MNPSVWRRIIMDNDKIVDTLIGSGLGDAIMNLFEGFDEDYEQLENTLEYVA